MRLFLLVFALIAGGCSSPKSVILDTDLAPDYDDVGALALLHALADNEEATICAVVSSNRNEATLPCVEVINRYYGRPDIPLGRPDTAAPLEKTWFSHDVWTDSLPTRYFHRLAATSDAPDAVEVYRRVLAQAKPQSVTIITIGFLSNLARLLDSPPDALSPLTGKELVTRSVKELVSMGGRFPEGKEYNLERDIPSAQKVLEEWPTPILLSGFEIGVDILTGKNLAADTTLKNSPVKDAYALSLPQDNPEGRSSWDQSAVLVGVRGALDHYTVERGILSLTPQGYNTWVPDLGGKHARLIVKRSPVEMAEIIETLMQQKPKTK